MTNRAYFGFCRFGATEMLAGRSDLVALLNTGPRVPRSSEERVDPAEDNVGAITRIYGYA